MDRLFPLGGGWGIGGRWFRRSIDLRIDRSDQRIKLTGLRSWRGIGDLLTFIVRMIDGFYD